MTCPICRQHVHTDAGGRNIMRHRDTCGNPCLASGIPAYTSYIAKDQI